MGENQKQGYPTLEHSMPAGKEYAMSILIGHGGGALGTCQHEDGALRSHVICHSRYA